MRKKQLKEQNRLLREEIVDMLTCNNCHYNKDGKCRIDFLDNRMCRDVDDCNVKRTIEKALARLSGK